MNFYTILSEPFSTLDTFSQIEVIVFYLTIIIAAIIPIILIIIKKSYPDYLQKFLSGIKSFIFGYALAISAIIFTLTVNTSIVDGSFQPLLFYPIMSIFVVTMILLGLGGIVKIKKPNLLYKYKIIALIIATIPVIVSIIIIAIYYNDVKDYYSNVSELGLYISAIILIAILAVFSFFLSKDNKGFSSTELAYAAISVATAFALSNIKFFKLPQGGSITLVSMLPIMLYSYIFGTKKGIIIGIIYGFLQAIIDPYIIHPAQFFLDYPIAFGMLGLAGVFKEHNLIKNNIVSFVVGAILSGIMRYFSHVLSGIFAFSCYAADGYSAVGWGFIYNTFTLADTALVVIVGIALFSNKSFNRLVNQNIQNKEKSETAENSKNNC